MSILQEVFFQTFSSRLFCRDMGDAPRRSPEIQAVSNVYLRFSRRNIGWFFLEKSLALVLLLGIIWFMHEIRTIRCSFQAGLGLSLLLRR